MRVTMDNVSVTSNGSTISSSGYRCLDEDLNAVRHIAMHHWTYNHNATQQNFDSTSTTNTTSMNTPTEGTHTNSVSTLPLEMMFVCLGNICRSPAAEYIFQKLVDDEKIGKQFVVNSCGLGGGVDDWYISGFNYHDGDGADRRMTKLAMSMDNIDMSGSKSTVLTRNDLIRSHIIVAMDKSIRRSIFRAAKFWDSTSPTVGRGGDRGTTYRNKQGTEHLQNKYIELAREKVVLMKSFHLRRFIDYGFGKIGDNNYRRSGSIGVNSSGYGGSTDISYSDTIFSGIIKEGITRKDSGEYYDVLDPYYGGPNGFVHVFKLLTDTCRSLFHIVKPPGCTYAEYKHLITNYSNKR